MSNLEFMSKFKPETRCIKEFEHWIICIRGKSEEDKIGRAHV